MNILISGSTGRMGTALKNVIFEETNDYKFSFGFTTSGTDKNEVNDLSKVDPKSVDLVIDFSLPESFPEVFNWCKKNKKALVSGTTGFDISDYKSDDLDFPFMYSGNYSLGISVLRDSLKNFSVFKDAKVWIEDVHHSKKIDSPSGTALMLKEAIKTSEEIEVHAIRGGSVFGLHRVHLVTDSEWLTFTHQALNREVFARGALLAGDWLRNQPPGFYDMKDFLKS